MSTRYDSTEAEWDARLRKALADALTGQGMTAAWVTPLIEPLAKAVERVEGMKRTELGRALAQSERLVDMMHDVREAAGPKVGTLVNDVRALRERALAGENASKNVAMATRLMARRGVAEALHREYHRGAIQSDVPTAYLPDFAEHADYWTVMAERALAIDGPERHPPAPSVALARKNAERRMLRCDKYGCKRDLFLGDKDLKTAIGHAAQIGWQIILSGQGDLVAWCWEHHPTYLPTT